MIKGLIEEDNTDCKLGEEAREMIKSRLARVDESVGSKSTKVIDVIGEYYLNCKRREEGREMVNGVAEGPLHGERGEGRGEIVNVLVEFSGDRETFERGGEVVEGVVEIAGEGEGEEGGGKVVEGLVEVGTKGKVGDVGVGEEIGEDDGESVVVVEYNFVDVGRDGRGKRNFVEEDAFWSVHLVISSYWPVKRELRYRTNC